jgi:hypothetical protein
VWPGGDVVLQWSDSLGASFCHVEARVAAARFNVTEDATVEAKEALFAVGQGVLRVIDGAVILRVGETTRQLEPRAQIQLPDAPVTGRPPPPTWDCLSDLEQEIVDTLRERRGD